MATVRSRALKDRRSDSRIIARLNCRFEIMGAAYDAVLVDVSQRGALISSRFLPPNGAAISICIKSRYLDKELSLKGTVLRGSQVTTDHGKMGRFVVHFAGAPLDLLLLISKLHTA